MSYRIDDFDGEYRDMDTMDSEWLLDVREQTVKAMTDPSEVAPRSHWENQLELIDEELGARGIVVPS